MIRINLETTPVAKGRPRFSRKTGTTYTPAATRVAEEELRWLMRAQWKAIPIEDPIAVGFRFYMPMPSSWSKKKQVEFLGFCHTQKPDLDNLIKLVKDAGNGIIWKDDSIIWAYDKSFKVWSRTPRIELYVDTIVGTN